MQNIYDIADPWSIEYTFVFYTFIYTSLPAINITDIHHHQPAHHEINYIAISGHVIHVKHSHSSIHLLSVPLIYFSSFFILAFSAAMAFSMRELDSASSCK
jgi:hypothetical protein